MLKISLIVILVFLVNCSQGQIFNEYNFKFQIFNSKQGLVHDAVKECINDADGFLWVITENGLSRFDGHHFKNFLHDPKDTLSIPANNLVDIDIDKNNNLWIAYEHGFFIIDPKTFRIKRLLHEGISLPAEKLIYSKADNKVYIVSQLKGMYAIDASNYKIEKTVYSKELTSNPVFLTIDKYDNLWIPINRNALIMFNVISKKHGYFPVDYWPMEVSQKNDSLYYCTTWGDGIKEFSISNPSKELVTHNYNQHKEGYQGFIGINLLKNKKLLNQDELFVSTYNNGLLIFNHRLKKFVADFYHKPGLLDGIPNDFFHFGYIDKNDNLWLCSWNDGLIMLSKPNQRFTRTKIESLNTNNYNCISSIQDDPYDANIAWMSVIGTGLGKIDKIKNDFVEWHFRELGPVGGDINYDKRWMHRLYKDSNNTLWAASYNGFAKIKHGLVSYVIIPGELPYTSNTFMDDKKNIWAAGNCVVQLITKTEKFKKFYLPEKFKLSIAAEFINAIEQKDDSTMYIGTNWGLFELNKNTSEFKNVSFTKSNDWQYINSLCRINNNLYIGTKLGVLSYDIKTKKTFLLDGHFTGAVIPQNAMKSNNQLLWVYSNKGLLSFNTKTKSMNIYTKNDGVYGHSIDNAYLFEYKEAMYLGHRMAYTKFNPNNLNDYKNQPLSKVISVSVPGKDLQYNILEINNKLKLYHENPNISISYTGIEYNYPEKVLYSTYLEGYDKEWSTPNSSNKKEYTNLSPGQYTFYIKATNPNSIDKPSIDSFTFKVVPAFWQTLQFKLLSFLTLLGLVVFFVRKRIDNIRKKELEKTEVNKRMAELDEKLLRSQMNPHFIFNSLNSIQKFIWESKEEEAAEYLAKFAKLMRGILENSRKESVTLQEEFDVMKLYIDLEQRRTNGIFDYNLSIADDIEKEKILLPPLILQPFIENAIWHGLSKKRERGLLKIEVKKEKDQLICVVEDDGIGINAIKEASSIDKKSLGMSITQQRIERLMQLTNKNASIVVSDKKEQDENTTGTKVVVSLPLIYNFNTK